MFSSFVKTPLPSNRRIGPERSVECAAIHAASFAYPWNEADFERLLLAPEVVATGAIDVRDCNLAGFVLSRAALDEAEILTVAVARQRRRCGIGKSLMAAHLTGLAAIGVKRLFLEVDADNAAALALYASYGFRKVAERKGYYRTLDAKQAGALVMRRDLEHGA
jgi:ribosomal-protein-alanine N-acetyltransferase